MAITLATLRERILAELGQPVTGQFYYNATTPYYKIDNAANAAELDAGRELMAKGAESILLRKSATIVFPAQQAENLWSTLDTTGALPGQRIITIKDLTTSFPQYIRMEIIEREDMYDPTLNYGIPRYPEIAKNLSLTKAFLVGTDTIVIYPAFGQARNLLFRYIPYFGKMSVVVGQTAANDSVLPDDALPALVYRACSILLAQKERDTSQVDQNYAYQIQMLINTLQNGRGAPYRNRPRFKGIRR